MLIPLAFVAVLNSVEPSVSAPPVQKMAASVVIGHAAVHPAPHVVAPAVRTVAPENHLFPPEPVMTSRTIIERAPERQPVMKPPLTRPSAPPVKTPPSSPPLSTGSLGALPHFRSSGRMKPRKCTEIVNYERKCRD